MADDPLDDQLNNLDVRQATLDQLRGDNVIDRPGALDVELSKKSGFPVYGPPAADDNTGADSPPHISVIGQKPITAEQRAKFQQQMMPAPPPPTTTDNPADRYLQESVGHLQSGWENLWKPSEYLPNDRRWFDEKAGAASETVRGGLGLLAPAALPALTVAPLPVLGGLVGGSLAGMGTEKLATAAGVPPGEAALAGDVAGMWGGEMGGAGGHALTEPASALIDRINAWEAPSYENLGQSLQQIADAASERVRQGIRQADAGYANAKIIPPQVIKDMTTWGAAKLGQAFVDPVTFRKGIAAEFEPLLKEYGRPSREAWDAIYNNAKVKAIRQYVRPYRLGMTLDQIHPLTSETIPMDPSTEPDLNEERTRLYSGHEQGNNSRIWTPDRAQAESPLTLATNPSQLSYFDVPHDEVPQFLANEQQRVSDPQRLQEEKAPGKKLMIYTPGQQPERAGVLLVRDVQNYLQNMVRRSVGAVPDEVPDHIKARRMFNYVKNEFQDQLQQPYSGLTWYGPDTAESDRLLRLVHPELEDADLNVIQKAITAAMSNNSNPKAEAFNGSRIWREAWIGAGGNPARLQFPMTQPNGKNWPAQGAGYQIAKLNRMLQELGPKGTADFLRERNMSGRDIRYFNDNAEATLDGVYPGSRVLGPKIGVYFDKVMNMPSPGSVVDVWMMRQRNRLLGNFFDNAGQEIKAPRTDAERALSMNLDARLAQMHNIEVRDAQSVRWHYEQELYRRMGLNVKSYRRSQGIQQYLDSLGLTGLQ